ncbi:hypothetical protein L207DRAFT_511878 [Hyaloscypha variabilis F]|uniref:2EXR domain-containing protein n=1 Tax=Hyaloscypha variabilis (strain UAMH 11265 / GT02V1 / F) TaxID=1149755 RepID=A0A2J6RPE5_HYAVF|nr:hypothetical protein L207DRAFT_511878 [Hyaloscypha variabilis F]
MDEGTNNPKPRLPTELLDKIWDATICCTGPRIVDLRCESKMDGLTSSCRIPPLLHTCSRSRQLALQRWKLCFPSLDENGQEDAKVFFDYEQDTLFFTQEFVDICQFAMIVSREERMRIRSVAFDFTVVTTMFNGVKFGRTLVQELHADVRLAFVLREGREDEQAWGREGKIVSFFPVRKPRDVMDYEDKQREIRFVEQLNAASSASVSRGVPRFKYVGIRIVDMENEAWNLRALDSAEGGEADERWWKTGWKIWYQNGARS